MGTLTIKVVDQSAQPINGVNVHIQWTDPLGIIPLGTDDGYTSNDGTVKFEIAWWNAPLGANGKITVDSGVNHAIGAVSLGPFDQSNILRTIVLTMDVGKTLGNIGTAIMNNVIMITIIIILLGATVFVLRKYLAPAKKQIVAFFSSAKSKASQYF